MENYSILLVDDEPVIRQGLEVLIHGSNLPFSVLAHASNGQKALDLMHQKYFDLVITDIEMPEMDGLEFIKQCKKLNFQSRFMVLSGFDRFDYARQACHFGVEDYLLNPVETNELYRILEQTAIHLNKDSSIQKLWTLFFTNPDDMSIRSELYRKYQNIRGWYYLMLQFENPVSLNFFPPDKICIRESDPCRIGMLLNEEIPIRKSINEQLIELSQNLINQGRRTVFFTGIRVLSFTDLIESKESTKILEPLMFYRDWNSIIHSGEECSFSNEETWILSYFERIRETFLSGKVIDNEVDFLYQELLNHRLKPSLCRIQIQQFLFSLFPYLEKWHIRKEGLVESYFPLFSTETNCTLKDLIQLLKELLNYISEGQSLHRKNGSSALVEEIVVNIKRNYVLNVNLQDLSVKYRMNKAYLGQLFKKHVGDTFHEYLNNVRLEESKKLLRQTDLKIYQVAYQVGYRDPSYFMSRFEKKIGLTPLSYRRKHSNDLSLD